MSCRCHPRAGVRQLRAGAWCRRWLNAWQLAAGELLATGEQLATGELLATRRLAAGLELTSTRHTATIGNALRAGGSAAAAAMAPTDENPMARAAATAVFLPDQVGGASAGAVAGGGLPSNGGAGVSPAAVAGTDISGAAVAGADDSSAAGVGMVVVRAHGISAVSALAGSCEALISAPYVSWCGSRLAIPAVPVL